MPAGLDRTHGFLWIAAQHLQDDEGEEDQRDMPDQRLVDPALAGGQASQLLGIPENGLNGLLTSDKFCWTRHAQLRLTWWRRALRQR